MSSSNYSSRYREDRDRNVDRSRGDSRSPTRYSRDRERDRNDSSYRRYERDSYETKNDRDLKSNQSDRYNSRRDDRDYRRHRSRSRDRTSRDNISRHDREIRPRNDRNREHDFENRRLLREDSTVTPWLDSPDISETDSIRSLSPKKSKKKSKKSKKESKYSDDERESSSKRRHRSKRSKEERSSRKKHRSRTSDSEDESREKRHRRRHSSSPEPSSTSKLRERSKSPEKIQSYQTNDVDEIGPQPLISNEVKFDPKGYGGDLLAGEGEAMASYVQSGKRIPRRGEIGLDSQEISTFESSGYVMSGSRHQRMNAVRIRKENQVISAEEKRTLLKLSHDEKVKQEAETISTLRDILHESMKKE